MHHHEPDRLYGGYNGVIEGSYWDNGKENGNYCSGFILLVLYLDMEKKMETTSQGLFYWGYIGIMEKKIETTNYYHRV